MMFGNIGKKSKTAVLVAVLTAACGFSAVAQSAESSYYVSANGSDGNNGLSEGTPFKTLAHAVGAAGKGAVKTITVLGTLKGNSAISNTGAAEILIRGKPDGEKAVLQGNGEGSVLRITGAAVIRLENVKITGGSNSLGGGGVYIDEAVVTLGKGGEISGNEVPYGDYSCGGVYVLSGTFTMSGGEISGNTAENGGGVYIENESDAAFTMTGGAISGNTASGSGGGVYVTSGAAFTQGKGAVSGNAAKNGADVFKE
ncbi:MAG: hypothetical protein LBB61_00175 [Treponema sp.]|jgi:hypothetical protein|nr:hypothetical protein [Treponema sp.]